MYFTLKFLKHLALYEDVQPYRIHGIPGLKPEDESNCEYEEIDNIMAQDIREGQNDCCMEEHGFEVMHSPSKVQLTAAVLQGETPDAESMITAYLEETMELVKKRLSTSSVFTIDWRYRRNCTNPDQPVEPADFRRQALAVAAAVHCDFSQDGGRERIRMHLNDNEWEGVESGRLRPNIVNVWRPLKLVTNAPLVLSDRRTINKPDVVEVDQVMTDKVTKTAYLYHEPEQKWYWLSNQMPDEAFIFVTWMQSSSSGHADYPPHAAAYRHRLNKDMEPRESIEVRMVVLQK